MQKRSNPSFAFLSFDSIYTDCYGFDMAKKAKVEKNHNSGTMTESAFWGMIRSGFRRQFRFWKPLMAAKQAVRRPYVGPNKRQKFEYQCNHCKNWFIEKKTQVDHVIPTGSLLTWEDVVPFLQRLIPEDAKSFQVLCLDCHTKKTNSEREARSLKVDNNISRANDNRDTRRKDTEL